MSRLEINTQTGVQTVTPLTPSELSDVADRVEAELEQRAAEQQASEDTFSFDGVMLTIAKALHNHENRLRVLEGKGSLTLKQVVKALRSL